MRTQLLRPALAAAIAAASAVPAAAGNAPRLHCEFELITLADGQAIQMPTRCCDPSTLACAAFTIVPAAPSLELPAALDALLTQPARIVDLIPTLGPERANDPQQWKQNMP